MSYLSKISDVEHLANLQKAGAPDGEIVDFLLDLGYEKAALAWLDGHFQEAAEIVRQAQEGET